MPTVAPTDKPPKPADRSAPLIILYSDWLSIYCREAARRAASYRSHDCHGNAMGASPYIAVFVSISTLTQCTHSGIQKSYFLNPAMYSEAPWRCHGNRVILAASIQYDIYYFHTIPEEVGHIIMAFTTNPAMYSEAP